MDSLANRIAALPAEKRALLELRLKDKGATALSAEPIIPRRSESGSVPLSFPQQRLWFLEQLEPGTALYNIPSAYHVTGPLNLLALEQGLNEIVRRHEALRTTFATTKGRPVQAIAPTLALALNVVELDKLSKPDRESNVRRLVAEEAQRPFDLTHGPLVRATVLRLGQEENALLLTMHHIVSDGWSMSIFFRELAALYEAYSAGRPSLLPELSIQYTDYAVWQRNRLQGDVLRNHIAYWKNQLNGICTLQLPVDRPRPVVQSYRGATQSLLLPSALASQLHALSRREGATLFMTLLAAFQALLGRYCGQDDIALGTPIAGRTRSDTEGMIGLFVNTLVIRTDLSGNPNFRELLARVRTIALAAYEHQELPFEKLVEELHPQRDLSHSPLFQVTFAHQNQPWHPLEFTGLAMNPVPIKTDTAKFDVSLETWEEPEGLRAILNYRNALFDETTATRILSHFQTILEGIVANPNRQISELPIMAAAERRQLLVDWNGNTNEFSEDKCIHQLIEEQVAKTPDELAVVCEDEQLTYRELNQRANQLAHYLRKLGVGPDDVVGLCLDHCANLLVGLLGILKAGGAYLPLDPDHPKARLEFTLEDSQASVLLTQERLQDQLPNYTGKKLILDSEWPEIAAESREDPHRQVNARNLAYVIFTSGSTGKPKGVMIEHRSLTNYLNFCVTTYPIQAGRGSLVHSSIAFDATITGLFAPLFVGRAVYLLRKANALDAVANKLCQLRDFSLVKITPAHLAALSQQISPQDAKDLTRCFVIGGENLLADQIAFWQNNAPNTLLFNEYGPTENVVGCIVYEASKWRGSGSVPIGRAIPNTSAYVLDQYMQPVPIGVQGELYLGGKGVARGYLNRAELTLEKFMANPFSRNPRARLYRTGDLTRYLPDGTIEFIGRGDHQVKIRGYRIELGEIASTLCQHPAIREAVVLAVGESSEDRRLVGYFVSDQQPSPTSAQLKYFLKEQLPEYMVPSAFVCMDRLPLTPNGKVDRTSLPSHEQANGGLAKDFVAPRDALEHQLTKIWENLLQVKPIGIRDNFFELGGHSLLAIKLFAEIEKVTTRKIPLAVLFQAPTLEQLATIVQLEVNTAACSSLVPIQANGSKPPCFLVPGGAGAALYFADLARHMDSDQPLYALQSSGINGDTEPLTQIKSIAAHFINEIRRVQSCGPYLLVGVCLGGAVVFEMAQQLAAGGQKVALLILVETIRPSANHLGYLAGRITQRFKHSLLDRFAYHGQNLKDLAWRERAAYIWRKTSGATQRVIARFAAEKSMVAVDSPLPAHWVEVGKANTLAVHNYRPKRYPGRITLFLTESSNLGHIRTGVLAWRKLAAGGVDVHTIPGDHTNMVWDPQAQSFAAKLRECINKALHQEPHA